MTMTSLTQPLPALVGIAGRKRSGKDTASRRLLDGYGYERIAFADNVRRAALAVNPWVPTLSNGSGWERLQDVVGEHGDWESAKTIPDVRRLLQRVGTEMGQEIFGRDVWVSLALRDYDERATLALPAGERKRGLVITDVRFPHEVDAVHERGGLVVRLVRPAMDEVQAPDEHPSERLVDELEVDATVVNHAGLHPGVTEMLAFGTEFVATLWKLHHYG
jgi:hypothetical protein